MRYITHEQVEFGKALLTAYRLAEGHTEDYAMLRAQAVDATSIWAQTAQKLEDMGYLVTKRTTEPKAVAAAEFLQSVERLAANAKATLEAEEAKAEPNKRLVRQWRFALNRLVGTTYKRGLLPDLKEAGPGAY